MKATLLILTVLINGEFSIFNQQEDVSFSVFSERPELSIFEEKVPTVFKEPCSDISDTPQRAVTQQRVVAQQPRLIEVIRINRARRRGR